MSIGASNPPARWRLKIRRRKNRAGPRGKPAFAPPPAGRADNSLHPEGVAAGRAMNADNSCDNRELNSKNVLHGPKNATGRIARYFCGAHSWENLPMKPITTLFLDVGGVLLTNG